MKKLIFFILHIALSIILIQFVGKGILNSQNFLLNMFGGLLISCIFVSIIFHIEKIFELKEHGKFK